MGTLSPHEMIYKCKDLVFPLHNHVKMKVG